MPPVSKRIFVEPAELAKFLGEVEATRFGLRDVDVVRICDSNVTFYGSKGTSRRTGFLRKFNQLRRSGIVNYSK